MENEELKQESSGSKVKEYIDKVFAGGDDQAFTPAYLEIQKRPPAPLARVMTITLMGVVLAVILWSIFAEFDVVVTAPGKVVPSDHIKVIQPLEPGVVKAIHVRDGQKVKGGQILIEMDPTYSQADRDRLAKDAMEAKIEVQRLMAQSEFKNKISGLAAGGDPLIIRTQNLLLQSRLAEYNQRISSINHEIAKKKAEKAGVEAGIRKLASALPLFEKRLAMKEELVKAAYVSELAVIDNKMEVSNQKNDLIVMQAKLDECDSGIQAVLQSKMQTEAEFKSKTLAELTEARKKLETTSQELIKAERRKTQQTLVAPSDGIVQQLAVHTIGGVVTAAQPLLTVIPEGMKFEVEAQVLNKDIGFLKPGQDVVVKFDAFEYTKYGYLNGKLEWVGTDSIQDQKLGLIYPVRILVSGTELPSRIEGNRPTIGAGMTITADISVSKRKAYEFFLSPLLRYKTEALRER